MRKVEIGQKLVLPFHADKTTKIDKVEGTVVAKYKRFFRVKFEIGKNKKPIYECYSYWGELT